MTQYLKSVWLRSLDSKDYILRKPIRVSIVSRQESYVASFPEASVSSSGETLKEALLNLKDMIISSFALLKDHPASKLGKGMIVQKRVLCASVRKI